MIQENIKNGIKEAMLAKDTVRLGVLRGLTSAFTNELVSKGKMPQDTLTDEEAMIVITRAAKQRKDSIEQFEKGGRPELAADEKAELEVIESFLPELMSREEVEAFVLAKKAEMNISDKSQMGQFMGAVMQELKGKADGAIVKEVVEKSLE